MTSRPIAYPCLHVCLSRRNRSLKIVVIRRHRLFILLFTFICYVAYHQSRKPISVVKSVLHQNCSLLTARHTAGRRSNVTPAGRHRDPNWCNWPPFNQKNWSQLLGSLDYAYLFAYAIGMFLSGHLAERLNLRRFLSMGMILSGLTTIAFGLAYFLRIQNIYYFLLVQIVGGAVQSSGWPSVVTLMGNWFGKSRRGFIMGLWNSHTSVGNILGSLLAGMFVQTAWGWSFVVPGLLILGVGLVASAVIVVQPQDIDCEEVLTSEDKTALLTNADDENSDLEEIVVNRDGTERPRNEANSAISIWGALQIPGVVAFALVLFFAKLVSYTFLYWLPNYIKISGGFDPREAADLSTLFDFGGIFGGVVAGAVSDFTGASASVCCTMLFLAVPGMYMYQIYGASSFAACIILLFVTGFLVNGPYALITTAVSADLGTHKSLRGRTHALATVTAIIDGTGSMGAALGPLLTGLIVPHGWSNVFYMLIGSNLAALVVCTYIVVRGEELIQLSLRWPNCPMRVSLCKRVFVFLVVVAVSVFVWRLPIW